MGYTRLKNIEQKKKIFDLEDPKTNWQKIVFQTTVYLKKSTVIALKSNYQEMREVWTYIIGKIGVNYKLRRFWLMKH